MDEEPLEAPLSTRLSQVQKDRLISNAGRMGSTKDIVLRELVRAFNAYCEGGRRPTFPLELASPGYTVEAGRVKDATPIITAGRASGSPYPQAPADTDARAVNEVVNAAEKTLLKKKSGPSAATDSPRK